MKTTFCEVNVKQTVETVLRDEFNIDTDDDFPFWKLYEDHEKRYIRMFMKLADRFTPGEMFDFVEQNFERRRKRLVEFSKQNYRLAVSEDRDDFYSFNDPKKWEEEIESAKTQDKKEILDRIMTWILTHIYNKKPIMNYPWNDPSF